MQQLTMILDLDDDGAIRLASDTLGGARVGIRRAGQPERVIQVRRVYESDIEQYVRGLSDCEVMGAWNMLDAAREVVVECTRRSVDNGDDVVKRLHVPISARVPDLDALVCDVDESMPLVDERERLLSDELEVIRQYKAARRETAAVARSASAAHDGHLQQPRVEDARSLLRSAPEAASAR